MVHHEKGAHSLNIFKAAINQKAEPGPKLSGSFQRKMDLSTELAGPLAVDCSEDALEASYIDIMWANTSASSYLRNRPPFTFPE